MNNATKKIQNTQDVTIIPGEFLYIERGKGQFPVFITSAKSAKYS